MRLMRLVLVLVVVSIGAASTAWSDVVELKTGQRVEGTLKQADQTAVTVEVGGQTIIFKAEQVRAVYYGAAPSATTSSSPSVSSSAAAEALRALKGLQSVTTAGVTYRDYGPRVQDAKIIVDRFVQDQSTGDPGVRSAIGGAMNYYVLASFTWLVIGPDTWSL